MNKLTKTFKYGDQEVTLETGQIARQASGSVMVSMGDTRVMVTVVGRKEADPGRPFFPLTVNYQEKFYAAGRIPGGFFKREGRPTEHETLICRLIDRPIRPLFPKGFMNEVQVIATLMSSNPDISGDIPALIGTSAALALSGMPFNGPIGAARVGYIGGNYVLNPTATQLEESDLDLVVAGTESAVLMVESEAKLLSEDVMLGAVTFGHEASKAVVQAVKELAEEVGVEAWQWEAPAADEGLAAKVAELATQGLKDAYAIADKMQRRDAIGEVKNSVVEALCSEEDEDAPSQGDVSGAFSKLEKSLVREHILSGNSRIDGRDLSTVRPISVECGVLPRAHGSALVTRGETQAIVATTLGTGRDAQIIDAVTGEYKDPFMLHYNFPPYSVGEVKRVGSPSRRDIGHGGLSTRAIARILPDKEDFDYTVRLVSEVFESNGSSSMGTVCSCCLALMDGGVPIKAPVSGIAMGLIKEGDQVVILSDILGDEDHFGDMDFKVTGTSQGITALQMDIKILELSKDIMEKALEQARNGRIHILGKMMEALDTPRDDISPFAPKIVTIKINPDKIRDVIGPGGKVIRAIQSETDTRIDISDDGTIKIAAANQENGDAALEQVKAITMEPEEGAIYEGKVVKTTDFGAFVQLTPGTDGLVHISQLANRRVNKVTDVVKEGDVIKVKVLEVSKDGRIRLSHKAVLNEEKGQGDQ